MMRALLCGLPVLLLLAGCNGKLSVGGCVDNDGDGFGLGCQRGPDCDDGDRYRWSRCEGDGGTGDGPPAYDGGTLDVLDPGQTIGLGGVPFDPTPANSNGVEVGPGGELRLPTGAGPRLLPHIWIANSSDGTVSKLDTRTGVELGRYRAGPGNSDPSRTTVSLAGHVVVANRGGASATKVAGTTDACVDRNGNGSIETSTGAGDVKGWMEDECVLWNTAFEGGSLARAAAYDAEVAADAYDSASVWIGLFNRREIVQLRSSNGEILARVDVAPVQPYGMAMDRNNQVWVTSGAYGSNVMRVHAVTHEKWQPPNPSCGYGIAIDESGRVFSPGQDCIARLDPGAGDWVRGTVPGWNRGIAVDGAGSVWTAVTSSGANRIDANTLGLIQQVTIGGGPFIGAAIDVDGQVWVVNQGGNNAIRIDPTSYVQSTYPVGSGPYTYSDMTGFQLRNAAAPPGTYRQIFEGCGERTEWVLLLWDADTDADRIVTFRARGAASPTSFGGAYTQIGQAPPATSPIQLAPIFLPAGMISARFIELEIGLRAMVPGVTPALRSVTMIARCGVT